MFVLGHCSIVAMVTFNLWLLTVSLFDVVTEDEEGRTRFYQVLPSDVTMYVILLFATYCTCTTIKLQEGTAGVLASSLDIACTRQVSSPKLYQNQHLMIIGLGFLYIFAMRLS